MLTNDILSFEPSPDLDLHSLPLHRYLLDALLHLKN